MLAMIGVLSLTIAGAWGCSSLGKGHSPKSVQQRRFEYTKQAEIDRQGNICVSSDQGKLIRMADMNHCWEAVGAVDQQTIGCAAKQGKDANDSMTSVRLEIYRKGGQKEIIEPGGPIREWHFWKDGEQVEVYSGPSNSPGTHALYDSATARLLEKVVEPPDESLLPQWAKGPAQIEDESVPMSAALTEERTKSMAKVLHQIDMTRPGMRRKDLLEVFTTEGGISFPDQQTYVHKECPYIKVDVKFKLVNRNNGFNESPDDIIESISTPYLAWSVTD